MQVNWIDGTIAPPESGEYYIIIEAQFDNETIKKGDIELSADYYDSDTDEFDDIGERDNPHWKLLKWANIPRLAIPEELKGRVKNYFGHKVGAEE